MSIDIISVVVGCCNDLVLYTVIPCKQFLTGRDIWIEGCWAGGNIATNYIYEWERC